MTRWDYGSPYPLSQALKIPSLLHQWVCLEWLFIFTCLLFHCVQVSEWDMSSKGLLYDREWVLVSDTGVTIGQKREPRICLLVPNIDLARKKLILSFPGKYPTILDHFCPVSTILWPFMSSIDHLWLFLPNVNHLYPFLSSIDHPWPFLSTINHPWSFLSSLSHLFVSETQWEVSGLSLLVPFFTEFNNSHGALNYWINNQDIFSSQLLVRIDKTPSHIHSF